MSEASKCPQYLASADACVRGQCVDCHNVVKPNDATGRWFITMGHAGFNSPANNRQGYRSQAAAVAAHQRYAARRSVGVR